VTDERGLRWWRTLCTAAVALAGCATPAMQVPGVTVASHRLASLPSDGTVWDFDVSGNRTIDHAASVEARKNVDESIAYRLSQHGGHSFSDATMDHLLYAESFQEWALDAMGDIMAERLGRAEKKHVTVGDWRYRRSLGAWRTTLRADFVVVSMFLYGRNTAGRAFSVAIGGGTYAAQRAIFCVVHLQTARMVWCKLDATLSYPLTIRAGAQVVADGLLERMLRAGETAPIEPPPEPPARIVSG
jgi:hypothetical protein